MKKTQWEAYSYIDEALRLRYSNFTVSEFLRDMGKELKEQDKVLSEEELFDEVVNNLKNVSV